jgi:FdhE protein
MNAVPENWLQVHPYLKPIARFEQTIDAALRRGQAVLVPVQRWESYAEVHARGNSLLRSRACGLDFSAAATAALSGLVDRLAGAVLPEKLARPCREIQDRFQRFPNERALAIEWIASGVAGEPTLEHPGVLRFLGWTALSHVLARVVEGFALWPDSAHWGREYCPTCGSLPVMAQLVPTDRGRQRLLFCVCCKTRWKYKRIGCPYCGNDASDRLGILHVEGEDALRIDVCEECKGYVKTYANQGEEALFFADWTTLHLDVLARERGFQRMGASLYEVWSD